ncbi:MAG TPA: hypothetical protein VIJ31_13410 [Acidothermaceae bacterium]
MASPEECKAAIAQLAARLAGPGDRRANGLDRSVSAEVTDLGVVFRGHLHDGVLDEITTYEGPPAQIRLILSSDDLVLLAVGELSLGSAWLSGRVKLQASLTDMLRLRTMI